MLLFGLLFSQTKSPNRTPDLVIFVSSASLLTIAVLLAQHARAFSKWKHGPALVLAALLELTMAALIISDLIVYEFRR